MSEGDSLAPGALDARLFRPAARPEATGLQRFWLEFPWFGIVVTTFALVAQLKHIKARIHVPE